MTTSTATSDHPSLTNEGGQELRSRSELGASGAAARGRRQPAHERGRSRAPRPRPPDVVAGDDETMIINMGPQHPSTHGVLRLMLELQGETVLRCKPIVGYLHTGMEKTGEQLTYLQGGTNVTRMDYLSPMVNELVFSHGHRGAPRGRAAARGRRGSGCCSPS